MAQNFKSYGWQRHIWKDASPDTSLEKCKWQQQRDTSTHLSEWLNSRADNTKCWWSVKHQEFLFICGGNAKWWNHFWKTVWRFPTKLNIASYHVIWQSCSLVFTQRAENVYPHQILHMGVYSSFVSNCQNMEAIEMSISRRMDKLWYTQVIEYYLVRIRNELPSH